MANRRMVHWQEWRENWRLVLACGIGFSFSAVLNYSFGLFLIPISVEFGWSRAETSIGITINGIVAVLLSPAIGVLIDRYGVRRIALPGLVLLSVSIAAFALSSGSLSQWGLLWAIYSLVDLSVKSTVWTTAVALAFRQERSLAIAFTLSGVSIALVIGPPLTAILIASFGWRIAFVALGVGWGAVATLIAFPCLKDVRSSARPVSTAEKASGATDLDGLTVREAMVSRPLQLIAVSTFLTILLGVAVQMHQVPILMRGGLTMQGAAFLVSGGGVAGIFGKMITGWLMDRFDAGAVGGLTLAASGISFLFLLDPVRTETLAFLAILVIGYSSAAKLQICAILTTRFAGMRNFAVIFGFMSSMISLGAGAGPLCASLIYDRYQSYDLLLLAASSGTAVAAIMLLVVARFKPAPFLPSAHASA